MDMKKRYEELDNCYPVQYTNITICESILKHNLIDLRNLFGYSIKQLVVEMRVDASFYYAIESLERHMHPPLEWLDIIADFYNLEVWQLFIPNLVTRLEIEEEKP